MSANQHRTVASKSKLIPPAEAAERLGLDKVVKDSGRTIASMGRRGELEVRYVGKYLMVVEQSVDAIIAGSK